MKVESEAKQDKLVLHVRYVAARRPFTDPHAQTTQTLAAMKPAILEFFSLTEAVGQNGGKVYSFTRDGAPIDDLSVTLGQLAEGKHELKLDLIEQFEQG